MRIALLGDIALFGRFSMANMGKPVGMFAHIAEYLSSFDYVIGNLETPLTEKTSTLIPKSAHIKATPVDVETLQYLHIAAVGLANNHMFDYGRTGYRDTISVLDAAGISWFGAERRRFIAEKKSDKAIFTGYCCYSTNPYGLRGNNSQHGIELLNPRVMSEDIVSAVSEGALPVLCVHAGEEHVHFPNIDHVDIARKIARQNRFVYCGHHPHVIQGIEESQGSLLAYSLGNFCFDNVYDAKTGKPILLQGKANKQAIILELEVHGARLSGWRAVPIRDFGDRVDLDTDSALLVDLNSWSASLPDIAARKNYISMRQALRKEFVDSRIKSRDFAWYLRKATPNTALQLLNARTNGKRYTAIIDEFLRRE